WQKRCAGRGTRQSVDFHGLDNPSMPSYQTLSCMSCFHSAICHVRHCESRRAAHNASTCLDGHLQGEHCLGTGSSALYNKDPLLGVIKERLDSAPLADNGVIRNR